MCPGLWWLGGKNVLLKEEGLSGRGHPGKP